MRPESCWTWVVYVYEFSRVLHEPYASVFPYSTWPVAGALTVHVTIAPVAVMPYARTPVMASAPLGDGVGAGVALGLGVAVGVGDAPVDVLVIVQVAL